MAEYEIRKDLLGVWAKIQRADECITNLKSEINTFLVRNPERYVLVREFDSDGLNYLFIMKGDPAVPLRFSVLAGEILHHLRSALDHLITALVFRNGGMPTKNHGFPICTTVDKWSTAINDGRVLGIARTAQKLVSRQQPYRSPTPDLHWLPLLHEMDIQDKHSLLIVTTAAVKLDPNIIFGTDYEVAKRLGVKPGRAIVNMSADIFSPRKITIEGTELFRITLEAPDPTFDAKAQPILNVAFEKVGAREFIPVTEVLEVMFTNVCNLVDAFKPEFS